MKYCEILFFYEIKKRLVLGFEHPVNPIRSPQERKRKKKALLVIFRFPPKEEKKKKKFPHLTQPALF